MTLSWPFREVSLLSILLLPHVFLCFSRRATGLQRAGKSRIKIFANWWTYFFAIPPWHAFTGGWHTLTRKPDRFYGSLREFKSCSFMPQCLISTGVISVFVLDASSSRAARRQNRLGAIWWEQVQSRQPILWPPC